MLANGLHEWKKDLSRKQPYLITSSDSALLAFAGLCERWRMPNGETFVSDTVITGEANEREAAA